MAKEEQEREIPSDLDDLQAKLKQLNRQPQYRLRHKIELLHKSSGKMAKALELPKDRQKTKDWWAFLRHEVWIHLKRTVELFFLVLRKKG